MFTQKCSFHLVACHFYTANLEAFSFNHLRYQWKTGQSLPRCHHALPKSREAWALNNPRKEFLLTIWELKSGRPTAQVLLFIKFLVSASLRYAFCYIKPKPLASTHTDGTYSQAPWIFGQLHFLKGYLCSSSQWTWTMKACFKYRLLYLILGL